MNKFWKWVRNKAPDPDNPGEEIEERTLYINGQIASESWFDDDVTPALFKEELNSGKGNITLWVNSYGGDCFAADQIYNMLRDYPGKVTVKIDGIAASAASVIAMAGDEILVSPVSTILIHNPSMTAMGDRNDLLKAVNMLDTIKESIINAYMLRTNISHNKLSQLMDAEFSMDAKQAIRFGFADGMISRKEFVNESVLDPEEKNKPVPKKDPEETGEDIVVPIVIDKSFWEKLEAKHEQEAVPEPSIPEETGYRIEDLDKRLDLYKKLM